MTRLHLFVGSLSIVGTALSCPPAQAGREASVAKPASASMAPLAPEISAYLDAAIHTLRRVSRHRDQMNWDALRDSARHLSVGALKPRDVYPVVDWLLTRVDGHSFLQASRFGARGEIVNERFGYVRVPFFGGGMYPTLSDPLQNMIRRNDQAATCGWIVNLRSNGGRNMWPMLAGVGPLLADSIVGWNQTATGRSLWKYRNGASIIIEENGAAQELVRVRVAPYALRVPFAPVAVLIDKETGSSGEAIATAFRGRKETRFFGTRTSGMSTTNKGYRLPDGANMVITVGVYADRPGALHGDGVFPDATVFTPLQGPTILLGDPVIARATTWLDGQPACR